MYISIIVSLSYKIYLVHATPKKPPSDRGFVLVLSQALKEIYMTKNNVQSNHTRAVSQVLNIKSQQSPLAMASSSPQI